MIRFKYTCGIIFWFATRGIRLLAAGVTTLTHLNSLPGSTDPNQLLNRTKVYMHPLHLHKHPLENLSCLELMHSPLDFQVDSSGKPPA